MKDYQFSLRQFLIATTVTSLLLVWTVSVWTRLLAIDLYHARDAGFENAVYEAFANGLAWCAMVCWVTGKFLSYPRKR